MELTYPVRVSISNTMKLIYHYPAVYTDKPTNLNQCSSHSDKRGTAWHKEGRGVYLFSWPALIKVCTFASYFISYLFTFHGRQIRWLKSADETLSATLPKPRVSPGATNVLPLWGNLSEWKIQITCRKRSLSIWRGRGEVYEQTNKLKPQFKNKD